MCGSLRIGRIVINPGDRVPAQAGSVPWYWGTPEHMRQIGNLDHSPFARIETLETSWLSKGFEIQALKVEGFAENGDDGQKRWLDKPVAIKVAVKNVDGEYVSMAVVTRDTTPAERRVFQHDRIAVAARPEDTMAGTPKSQKEEKLSDKDLISL